MNKLSSLVCFHGHVLQIACLRLVNIFWMSLYNMLCHFFRFTFAVQMWIAPYRVHTVIWLGSTIHRNLNNSGIKTSPGHRSLCTPYQPRKTM